MEAQKEISITEYLVRDHARLHALLDGASQGVELNANSFEDFRAGLLRHIGIEEKILFPAVKKARGGQSLESAVALRVEHAALTSLLVPTPDMALCNEIRALLSDHDKREEEPGGVYAQCNQVLTPAAAQELGARAVAYPSVPLAKHFDGAHTHRTAEGALAAAKRIRLRHA